MVIVYKADSTKWISIAGNIGSGKSTLSELIAEELKGEIRDELVGYHLLQEEWKTNPYFNRYYEEINRFYEALGNGSFTSGNGNGKLPDKILFNAQYWWLTKKGNQNSEIPALLKTINVSQDRSIYEDGLFAKNFMKLGLISPDDANIYMEAYGGLSFYPLPDVTIYLETSPDVCKERIIKRGRIAERKIPLKYLEALDELYVEWWTGFEHPHKVTINTDGLNLVESPADMNFVMTILRSNLERNRSIVATKGND